jgi:hypothetical protein
MDLLRTKCREGQAQVSSQSAIKQLTRLALQTTLNSATSNKVYGQSHDLNKTPNLINHQLQNLTRDTRVGDLSRASNID